MMKTDPEASCIRQREGLHSCILDTGSLGAKYLIRQLDLDLSTTKEAMQRRLAWKLHYFCHQDYSSIRTDRM
jgi:hypothetical protein